MPWGGDGALELSSLLDQGGCASGVRRGRQEGRALQTTARTMHGGRREGAMPHQGLALRLLLGWGSREILALTAAMGHAEPRGR